MQAKFDGDEIVVRLTPKHPKYADLARMLYARRMGDAITLSRDAVGHEHGNDGRFASTGGIGGGTSVVDAPKEAKTDKPKTVADIHTQADALAENHANSGILAKLGAAGKWMKDKTKAVYDRMESRYGRKTAIAIFAAGHVAGLATPLVVVPGSTLIGMAPFAAMAEIYLQARKGAKAIGLSQLDELSVDEILAEGAKLADELREAWEGYQETKLSASHAPVGGVTIQGREFAGGEFIPGDVMAQATGVEKAKVGGAKSNSGNNAQASTREDRIAAKKKMRNDVRVAAKEAFGDKIEVDGNEISIQDNGRGIDLEFYPKNKSVFVEFTQTPSKVVDKSTKQNTRTAWDTTAKNLQTGTVDLAHKFKGFIQKMRTSGVGVEYETTEPRRARIYAKVLSDAGFEQAESDDSGRVVWRPKVDKELALSQSADDLEDPYHALASLYADLWNLTGQTPDDDELETVGGELADGGWVLYHDGDQWKVREGVGAVELSQARAPKGGVQIGSRWYAGGKWIPSAEVAKADPATKAKIEKSADEHHGKRASRGDVDVKALKEKLSPHAGQTLDKHESRSAKLAYAALKRHHGDLLYHRLEELGNQLHEALQNTPEDEEGQRGQISRRLKAVHDMLTRAEGEGVKQREVAETPKPAWQQTQAEYVEAKPQADPATIANPGAVKEEAKPAGKKEPSIQAHEKIADAFNRLSKDGFASTQKLRESLPDMPQEEFDTALYKLRTEHGFHATGDDLTKIDGMGTPLPKRTQTEAPKAKPQPENEPVPEPKKPKEKAEHIAGLLGDRAAMHDGLAPLANVYNDLQRHYPDMSVKQFQDFLKDAKKERAVSLKILNEVRTQTPQDRKVNILVPDAQGSNTTLGFLGSVDEAKLAEVARRHFGEPKGETPKPSAAKPIHEKIKDVFNPPAKDTAKPKESITPEQAEARKWKKNEDGTYTAPNGTVWRKAKAGGEESPVTGEPFKGGSLMPIHGLAPKKPQSEGQGQSAGDVKPNEQAKERGKPQPVQQMTPEDIEAEKQRREDGKKWDEMNAGPLGEMKWMGENPNGKAMANSVISLSPWRDYASNIGENGVKSIIEKIEPLVSAKIKAEVEAAGLGPKDQEWYFGQLKDTSDAEAYEPRKTQAHAKEVPSSLYARNLVQEALSGAKTVSDMHAINGILADAAKPKEAQPDAASKEPKPQPPANHVPPTVAISDRAYADRSLTHAEIDAHVDSLKGLSVAQLREIGATEEVPASGNTKGQLLESIRQSLHGRKENAERTGRGKTKPQAPDPKTNASKIAASFDKLDTGRNYLPIAKLRAAHPELSKADFDAAVNHLRRNEGFTGGAHEGRHGLTQEELDTAIRDERGDGQTPTLIGYLSRRNNSLGGV